MSETINLRFEDKCPVCRNKRNGERDPKFHHLIKTFCMNLRCNFKIEQIFHEEDYISENNILNFLKDLERRTSRK